jgi:hypothetical protein
MPTDTVRSIMADAQRRREDRRPDPWSTGAPLLFLRTLLGLEPVGNHLLVDPAVPTPSGVAGSNWGPRSSARRSHSGTEAKE